MDIEKFTERARGFIQAAQTIAIREFHQQLTPEHLLKALLDDEEGAAAGLIRAAGGDDRAARTAIEQEMAKLPKVQGGGAGQPQATPAFVRVLDAAQQAAQKAGDAFVAQDRLLVGLANSDTPAARALRPGGRFYMVANRGLPYEPMLRANFALFETLADNNKFRITRAIR